MNVNFGFTNMIYREEPQASSASATGASRASATSADGQLYYTQDTGLKARPDEAPEAAQGSFPWWIVILALLKGYSEGI
jgi:hypothetical protein